MDANEVLLNEVAALRQTCLDTLRNTSVLAERFDEFDRKLFGNGQPGEIDRHKTELAGVMHRVGKLETLQSRREGAAQTWGAVSGGAMWAIGVTLQYIWTRLKMGQH